MIVGLFGCIGIATHVCLQSHGDGTDTVVSVSITEIGYGRGQDRAGVFIALLHACDVSAISRAPVCIGQYRDCANKTNVKIAYTISDEADRYFSTTSSRKMKKYVSCLRVKLRKRARLCAFGRTTNRTRGGNAAFQSDRKLYAPFEDADHQDECCAGELASSRPGHLSHAAAHRVRIRFVQCLRLFFGQLKEVRGKSCYPVRVVLLNPTPIIAHNVLFAR